MKIPNKSIRTFRKRQISWHALQEVQT